jgi:diketogulonate reductase-like aldo/keto reductase
VHSQFDECLADLQTDHVDLLLVHHPGDGTVPMEETLSAFNEIHDAGKAKSIGISNFSIEQVDQARAISHAPITTNQVEYHAHSQHEDLLQHCHALQIPLTAHRPLAVGEIVDDPVLGGIGNKHGKTAAQVALRWLLQKGLIVIPKASSDPHLIENLDLFDWELTPEEMETIDNL